MFDDMILMSRLVDAIVGPPQMTLYEAVAIAEGRAEEVNYDPDDEELRVAAWQKLIDTGVAWQLQGSFGRMAAHMIEEGVCTR